MAVVLAYGIAMAFVESAAVLYLRTLYGGVDPIAPRDPPLGTIPDFLAVEVGREAATMLMLATVGWLAGRTLAGRVGAFVAAFGIWDVFYYVFLWLFSGWPGSPLAPDVLFLIPVPWWGPVLAPCLIALLMVCAGSIALAEDAQSGLAAPTRGAWALLGLGGCLCLVAFVLDALMRLPAGLEAAFETRGGAFPWLLYLVGLACASAGAARVVVKPPSRGSPARASGVRPAP